MYYTLNSRNVFTCALVFVLKFFRHITEQNKTDHIDNMLKTETFLGCFKLETGGLDELSIGDIC